MLKRHLLAAFNRLRSFVESSDIGKSVNKSTRRAGRKTTLLRPQLLEDRCCLAAITPDFGFYRPSNGSVHVDYAVEGGLNGQENLTYSIQGAQAADLPLVADFNGDTVDDGALFRPSTGAWFIDLNKDGVPESQPVFFGSGPLNMVIPVAGDIDDNGVADLGVYHKDTGQWEFNNGATYTFGGQAGDVPLLADFNIDGRADLVIYNPTIFTPDPTFSVAPFNRVGNWKIKTALRAGSPGNNAINNNNLLDASYPFGPFNGANDKPFVVYSQSPHLHAELGLYTTDGSGSRFLIDYDYDSLTQPPDGADTQYVFNGSNASDVPFSANFDAGRSIFVSTSGNDANPGTQAAPVRTINRAVTLSPNGQGRIIRIAAGTYSESIVLFQRWDLTFVGTGPLSSIIMPGSGDAFLLDRSSNIWINKVNLRAVAGRGLAAIGSSVTTLNINTVGSRDAGGLTVGYPVGGPVTITTYFLGIGSHFDSVSQGDGFTMQGGDIGTFSFCTFNANTGPQHQGGYGRGLTTFNNAQATIDGCAFVQNRNGGIITANNSVINITRSAFTENPEGNGILLKDNTRADINSSYFRHNGTAYGLGNPHLTPPQGGFNGIELLHNYTGACTITANTFFDSTAFGVFISGSTQNTLIQSNFFDHSNLTNVHRVCIGMNGALDINNAINPNQTSRATIRGNNFLIPTGSAQQEGIFMLGAGAIATIGGSDGSSINVFRNFAGNNAIDPSHMGGGHLADLGCPTILNDASNQNAFINCGMPFIRPCPI